jgi:hypothetical protein
MKLRKYNEKDFDDFFDDNAIEFDDLDEFLKKIKDMKIHLSLDDSGVLTLKIQLEDSEEGKF